jgi:hypothetical protein
MTDDVTIDLDTQRKHLERDTRSFFSKWYRRLLRWTLRKLIDRADELRDNSWGQSTCGCYVDDIHNTLCLWHELNTYLR